MSVSHVCPCTTAYPMQKAMEVIGSKWKLSILCALNPDGVTRYNDLKRKMLGISNTMLAKSLKELEDNGLIKRTAHTEVPVRVDYEISENAKTLIPILNQLAQWAANL